MPSQRARDLRIRHEICLKLLELGPEGRIGRKDLVVHLRDRGVRSLWLGRHLATLIHMGKVCRERTPAGRYHYGIAEGRWNEVFGELALGGIVERDDLNRADLRAMNREVAAVRDEKRAALHPKVAALHQRGK